MRLILLPLFLVGFATADNAWIPGNRYTYEVRGRTLTGIHQVHNQFAGLVVRGKLSVVVDNESQLTLQIVEAEYADINRNLSQGWATHIPDEDVEFKQSGVQDTPFQLHVKNGVVEKMVVEKNLPTWQVNGLKSVASLFQVDTQAVNLKHSKLNDIPHGNQQSGVYKTKEDSINGIYETLYEIYPMPDYVMQSMPELVPLPHLRGNGQTYNIEKTKNFSNSDYHIVYRYGMNGHEGWSEGTNQMGNMLARTSNSRIVITGDLKNYTIQYTETNEKVLVAPHMVNSQKGIVVSQLKMTLQSVQPSQEKSPSISSPRTIDNLVYEYRQEPQSGNLNERRSSSSSSSSSGSSSTSSSEEMTQRTPNRPTLPREWINPKQKTRRSKENMVVENQSSSYSSSGPSSSSSSEESSISSSEEYLSPQPKMNESQTIEFLPDNMEGTGSEREKIVEKITRVATKIGQTVLHPNKIVTENVLTSFSILTRLISAANTQQLQQAVEKLYYSESSSENEEDYPNVQNRQAWTAFRDALSQAGTGPALVTINTMIQSGKVKGEDAASLVAVLPTSARYPTTEYMEYFFEMVKSEVVQNQRSLNSTATIAFADLVRRSQVDRQTSQHRYPIHLSGPHSANHRAVVAEKYIPYFQSKLNSSITQGDSIKTQVYIRALGNMAHRKILAVFEPYLEGKYPVSNFQRLVMVASLDEMTRVYPNTARSVLYRVYQNQGESPEVRVAAVMQLMKTNPPAHLLQRMAEHTNYDHSKHVNAAVKSAIESVAKGENNENPEMTYNARSAANFLTPETYVAHYSKDFIWSFIEQEKNREQHQHHLVSIHGPDGEYPSSFIYTSQSKIGGYLRDPETISVMTSNSDDLTNYLLKTLRQKGDHDPPESKSSNYTYQKVYEILNGVPEVRRQVEGNMLVSLFGVKRFFTFDNHTIEQIPEVLEKIQTTLKNGVNHHQVKYYNEETVEIGFPMVMGLRFTYSFSSPTLQYFGFKGNGEIKQGTGNNGHLPQQVHLDGRYHYVRTEQQRGKLAFSFGQHRYVAGFERVAQVNVPIEGSLNVDVSGNTFKASIKPMSDKNEVQKLFEYRTDVYTTYHNTNDVRPYLDGPNVKKVQSGATKKKHQIYSRNQTGYALEVSYENEINFMNIFNLVNIKNLDHVPTNILKLTSHVDDTVASNSYTLSYNPQQSSSQETTFSISYKSSNEQEDVQQKRNSGRSNFYNYKNRETRRRMRTMAKPSEGESRAEEMLRNVNSGIQDGTANVIDASISFGADKSRGQYSLTIAHAESPVSEKSRYFIHYTRIPLHDSEEDKPYNVSLELNIKKPFVSLLNYNDAINVNPSSQIEGKINFGTSEDFVLTLQGKMERSERRKQYVVNHPLSVLCVEQMKRGHYLQPPCQNVTLTAGYLDKYEFNVNYKNVPKQVKKAVYTLYSIVRHATHQYITENVVDVQNQEGEMKVILQWSEDFYHLNVSAETPMFRTEIVNVDMEPWTIPLLINHPRYSPQRQIAQYVLNRPLEGMCTLDTANVTTFNNKTYPINLGNCNHVLAMYSPHVSYEDQQNSQHSQNYDTHHDFAILVKEDQSHKKVLELVLGESVVVLEPSGENSVSVSSNGKTIQVSESSITSWREGEHQLKVYVEPGTNNLILQATNQGIEVSYDGHHAKVLIPSRFRNQVRGLCGTFDGEIVNDFTSPKNCVLRNHQEFTASYAIADSSCQGPALELHRQAQNSPCYPKDVLLGDVVSDVEAGRGGNLGPKGDKTNRGKTGIKNKQGCTNHKVRIMETAQKTCFSITPQITCNPNCRPEGIMEKTIEFHCLNESSATRHWVTMVKKGANPDFSQKKSNHQMSVSLPEKCVPNL